MAATPPDGSVVREQSDDPPTFYRYHGRAERLLPTRPGSIHAWLFVLFLIATFGPMFHLFAGSTRLVVGWPITIGWILFCMILQSINLIVFYFTTVRPTVEHIDAQTDAEQTT